LPVLGNSLGGDTVGAQWSSIRKFRTRYVTTGCVRNPWALLMERDLVRRRCKYCTVRDCITAGRARYSYSKVTSLCVRPLQFHSVSFSMDVPERAVRYSPFWGMAAESLALAWQRCSVGRTTYNFDHTADRDWSDAARHDNGCHRPTVFLLAIAAVSSLFLRNSNCCTRPSSPSPVSSRDNQEHH
jgi:hypothetical protein